MKNLIAALLLISICSCSKKDDIGNPSDPYANKLNEFIVLPSATNPVITTYNDPHYVYLDTRVTPKNKLFIFLPGTTANPSMYSLIEKKAASLGYHCIGLMYPNSSDMYFASATNSDNTSYGRCRQEIFDGSDQSTSLNVDVDNCIKGRLIRLLEYLAETYPSLHWDQFLNQGDVNWSKCIVAGHSQGGGHAFYISKKVPLFRAISFSSIDWNVLLNESAEWIFEPGATPVTNLYSFNSTNDQLFNYSNVQVQLNDIGLPGDAVSIDQSNPPYNHSHRLTTSATPAAGSLAPDHNITCNDQYVPKSSNGEVDAKFAAAWAYLIDE